MKRLTIYFIALILFPLMYLAASCEANAQTVYKWNTYIASPPKNQVLQTTESGNYLTFAILDATGKKVAEHWVLKSALMKVQTVRDTVTKPCVCPPPIDCNNYSDYVQTRATLAQTIDELSASNAELDRLIEENVKLTARYSEAVRLLKWSEAERKKYKPITIMVPKDSL